MERGQGSLSAVQEVSRDYGLPVVSIVNLNDLSNYLSDKSEWRNTLAAIERYRGQYSVGE